MRTRALVVIPELEPNSPVSGSPPLSSSSSFLSSVGSSRGGESGIVGWAGRGRGTIGGWGKEGSAKGVQSPRFNEYFP